MNKNMLIIWKSALGVKNKKILLLIIFTLIFSTVPFFNAKADIYIPKICNSNADCPAEVEGHKISCRDHYEAELIPPEYSGIKRCLPPEVDLGGSCYDNLYYGYLCKGPLICFNVVGSNNPSTCVPMRKEGESCNFADSWQCEGSMVCMDEKCVAGKNLGEKCNEFSSPKVYCGKGLSCDDSGTQTCITDEEWGKKYGSGGNGGGGAGGGGTGGDTGGTGSSGGAFNYTPMEKIPGFETETVGNFYTYIQAVYKFGIWAVGIAALLMISIGGFMYITSAGNNTAMGKAKGVIADAVIGLVLALTAYLLLYIINPDLVKIKPLPIIKAKPAVVQPPVGGPPVVPTPETGGDTCAIYSNNNNVINFSTNESVSLPSGCAAYDTAFQSASSSTGVEIKVLKAIAAAESTCGVNLQSNSTPPSCGFMQLQVNTAKQYDANAISCDWLKTHPNESILIAAKYIAANNGITRPKEEIFAGYNAGYGTSLTSDGKKPAFYPSSDCPGAFAYQCCKNPGGLAETQAYIFKCEKYYNGQ